MVRHTIDRSAEGRNARNERKKSLARICCNGETNRLLKMNGVALLLDLLRVFPASARGVLFRP